MLESFLFLLHTLCMRGIFKLKPISLSEKDIENQILKLLRFKYNIFAWKNYSTGIYDPRTRKFRKAHTIKGVADILGVLLDGKLLAIEVKKKPNKPTIDQINFINHINSRHGIAFVAYNLTDVENHLDPYYAKNKPGN